MAEISWTRTQDSRRTHRHVWVLGNGDTGQPISIPGAADMSFQVYGTFGAGGTIVLQGSLDVLASGATYFTMKDRGGNALSFTKADGGAVASIAAYIRPNVLVGTNTIALTAILLVRT